jgi:hypothetical protein
MDLNSVTSSVNVSWSMISPLVSNLLQVLILLLIGFLVAKGVGAAITYLAKLILLDKGAELIGFKNLLEKGEIKRTAAELLGDLIYWSIIFTTVIGVAELFKLPIGPAMNRVFTFLGLILVAAIVLGVGVFLASFISSIVRLVATNFGIEGARTISRVIYYIVIVFAFLAALAQLGIGSEVFIPQIGVIIGAFGLAAAIAFGLGCKDMAADFLYNMFKGKA